MAGRLPRPAGVLLTAVLAVLADGRPSSPATLQQLQQQPQETLVKAQAYLTQFGWLEPTQSRSGSLQYASLSSTLAEFQAFAGLPITGLMDNATISKMQQPRCGVPDKQAQSKATSKRRSKRFAIQGSRWRSADLTYKIINWPLHKDRELVRKDIRDAFQVWADVSALTFTEVPLSDGRRVNIDIRFEFGDHGDGSAFDGSGGVLAHAFFPIYGGDAHFDKSEQFLVGKETFPGVNLFMVAAHEFGHSLGLSHSEDATALMAAFYKPPSSNRNIIKTDDTNGIQTLYGPPITQQDQAPDGEGQKTDEEGDNEQDEEGEEEEEEEEEEEDEEGGVLCADASVGAMVTMTTGWRKQTYVFKGENYWRLTDQATAPGYPKKVADKWGGLPDNIDAALVYSPSSSAKETAFFFKGNQVWRMSKIPKVDDGYPKLISEEFEGIPNDIDGAFMWKNNRKIYFFKGSQYWRFNYEKAKAGEQGVDKGYPRSLDVWEGIPADFDTVNTWQNGKTYFFKGNKYYRIRFRNGRRPKIDRNYPRDTGKWWFGCTPSQNINELVAASQRRGDITAEEDYKGQVVGYGEGDTRPRRSGAAAPVRPAGPLLGLLLTVLALRR